MYKSDLKYFFLLAIQVGETYPDLGTIKIVFHKINSKTWFPNNLQGEPDIALSGLEKFLYSHFQKATLFNCVNNKTPGFQI